MAKLDIIKAPIQEEMKKFQPFFKSSLKSKVALLDIITRYILQRKGKQMRPMLVFLTAKLVGNITDSTYNAAALIELMHTATLVHDDVVDDSYKRRGFFSINALWKNKIAVLIGDYFLSRGLLLAVAHKEYELLEIVSEAVREMSEGELLQIEKSRKLDISEEVYFDIIRKKTATLIASCAATGSASTGADKEIVQKLKKFGEYLGIAFQIKDDLFDYDLNGDVGKPIGNDLKERKMTLPLIYSLTNSNHRQRQNILKIVKSKSKKPAKIKEVQKFVKEMGGIDYTIKNMHEYKDKALSILDEFPDNEAKTSLLEFVKYTIDRNK
ncbi:MAG: polyprenyl synthetase family protein [Chlorobi bacterium]|nr:polyprenyl synthetase family protein [Chlorobiota bacterium]